MIWSGSVLLLRTPGVEPPGTMRTSNSERRWWAVFMSMSAKKVIPWPEVVFSFSEAMVISKALVAFDRVLVAVFYQRRRWIEHTIITWSMTSMAQDLKWTDKVKSIQSSMHREEDPDLTNRVLFFDSSNHGWWLIDWFIERFRYELDWSSWLLESIAWEYCLRPSKMIVNWREKEAWCCWWLVEERREREREKRCRLTFLISPRATPHLVPRELFHSFLLSSQLMTLEASF